MSTALASRPTPAVNSGAVFRGLALRFLRHGAGVLAAAVFILCGLPAMMYGFLWIVAPDTAWYLGDDPVILQTIFRIVEWFVVPALLLCEVTHVRPLYILPLTSRQILRAQLALGILAIVALHLFNVVFYRVAFGATLPLWGPLMILIPAVIAAAGLAAWLADFRWWRPFVAGAVVIGAGNAVGNRHLLEWLGGTPVDRSAAWLTPTSVEFFGIMLLGAVGYFLALRGIERDRCSELRAWPDLDTLLHSFAARLSRLLRSPVTATPYRSGVSAQFWFEFWQKGLILPIIATCLGGLSMIGAYYSPYVWLAGFADGLPVILATCFFVGGVITGLTNLGRQGKANGMAIGEYRATRPLTDTQLASAFLKAALATVFATAMIGAAFALIAFGWSTFEISERALLMSRGFGDLLPKLPATVAVSWCLLGLAASIAMTGRAWVMILPLALGIGALLDGPLVERLPMSRAGLEFLTRTFVWAVVLSIVAGSIAAYVIAFRRKLVSLRTVSIGGILWAAVTVGLLNLAALLDESQPMTLEAITIFATFAALVVVPLATAPLALSWNRHR